MAFRDPEIASEMGMLDDDAVGDGFPLSAHVLREMCRNANRLFAKSSVVFRWINRADGSVGDQVGAGISFPTAGWSYAIPARNIPAPKKLGATKLRVAVRAEVGADARAEMQITTRARLFNPDPPAAQLLSMLGPSPAAMTQYTIADIPCVPGQMETLNFHVRAVLDRSNDALMVEGTYGANNTGTVDGTVGYGTFRDRTSTWNITGNTPSNGGHYVTFYTTNNSMQTVQHGPARIVGEVYPSAGSDTDALIFHPSDTNNNAPISYLRGTTYEIRKLPSFRLASIAVYTMEGAP